MAAKRIETRGEIASKIEAMAKELQTQNDRGAALVAAAYLDDLLAAILRARFVDEPKEIEGLLGVDRPLGTFSSRIRAAYCIGLLRPECRRDLELIRKIRNDASHSFTPFSFEESPTSDRACDLLSLERAESALREVSPTSAAHHETMYRTNMRERFIANVLCLVGALLEHAALIPHVVAGQGFVPDPDAKFLF